MERSSRLRMCMIHRVKAGRLVLPTVWPWDKGQIDRRCTADHCHRWITAGTSSSKCWATASRPMAKWLASNEWLQTHPISPKSLARILKAWKTLTNRLAQISKWTRPSKLPIRQGSKIVMEIKERKVEIRCQSRRRRTWNQEISIREMSMIRFPLNWIGYPVEQAHVTINK